MAVETNSDIGLEDIFFRTENGKKALVAFGAAAYFVVFPALVPAISAFTVLGFILEGAHRVGMADAELTPGLPRKI